jgi:predicted 2-oxoglutarate/Fe(II)-dependent dioxygenase YbiX
MLQLKPSFEQKFSILLSDYEGPQFLIYGPGDFFKLHRDLPSASQNHPDKRKISITLFLNDGAHNVVKDEFQGGQLVLNCPQEKGFVQMPLRSVAGALVAFHSDLFHEVKPVIAGERITLVGWFH